MNAIGPDGQNIPFSRSNVPRGSHFCQIFSLTSVENLAMDPVGLHSKTAHFQNQTSSSVGKTLLPIFGT
ncbi:hypothetical protein H5410_053008 [Solanum commersonii]|uniref:Uncharacterized protein n=1 Tax=Solanum commersonii TaxID=4109 RepID=A0A9J5X4Q6_SOLCO|nr:hypothetical protein H5410_053008 [Solanum commersonii]